LLPNIAFLTTSPGITLNEQSLWDDGAREYLVKNVGLSFV
jgi:hypothetical protein